MSESDLVKALYDYCYDLLNLRNWCSCGIIRAVWAGKGDKLHILYGEKSGSSSATYYKVDNLAKFPHDIPQEFRIEQEQTTSWAELLTKDQKLHKRYQYCDEAPFEMDTFAKLAMW